MKLYAIRIFTTDWNRSLKFYRDAIGLSLKLAEESVGWAEFDIGGSSLAIESIDPETKNLVGRFVGISLRVDDIEATYSELTGKGVVFTSPPEKQSWGGTLAHFKDPDSNVITLLQF